MRALLAITRRLPRVKGAGRVADAARAFYERRPRPLVEASVFGLRMRLRPGQYVDGWLLFGPQFYEPLGVAAMRRLVPGDVFLDIGAYAGLYALLASRRVGPAGLVLAFEADPRSAAELRHNVAINAAANVRVVEVAVSDRAGRVRLAARSATNLASTSTLVSAATSVEADARPLLDVLHEHGVASVAGAKLDIEGGEFRVLSRFLADAPAALWPRFVLLEHYPELVSLAGGDALALLVGAGYSIVGHAGPDYVLELLSRSE